MIIRQENEVKNSSSKVILQVFYDKDKFALFKYSMHDSGFVCVCVCVSEGREPEGFKLVIFKRM